MEKEKQIRNMLEYLATNGNIHIRKCGEGIFDVSGYLSTSKVPRANDGAVISNLGHDENIFTIDFNKQTLEVYSYDVSGHNGDHYNCDTMPVAWEFLLTAYDGLKSSARLMAAAQVERETRDKIGNERLNEVLTGTYFGRQH